MKLLLSTLIGLTLCFSPMSAIAQWTDDGTSLTTNDRVGVGTTNPTDLLDVRGSVRLVSASGFSADSNNEEWVQLADRMQGIRYLGNAKRFEIEVSGGYHSEYGKVVYYIDARNKLQVVRHVINGNIPEHRLKIYSDDSKANDDAHKYIIGFRLGEGNSWWSINIRARNLRDSRWLYLQNTSEPASGFTEVTPTIRDNFAITASGNVGIGTTNPTAELAVNGITQAKEVIVTDQASDWPDYVFGEGYRLPDPSDLEAFISEHRHLPGIPTREEIAREGQTLGAIQAKLLEKIEELTLLTIKQQKEIEQLKQEVQKNNQPLEAKQ